MANISAIKVGNTSYGITATPTAHASTATTYGAASASNYGHVKLSDNYTSSAGAAASGIAASSAAVYNAYNTLNSNLNIFPDYANSIALYETHDIPNGDSTFSITIPETAYYTAFINTFDTDMRPFIRITINSKVIFQGYNATGVYMYLQSPILLLKKGTVAMFHMEGSFRKITKIPICTEVWQK